MLKKTVTYINPLTDEEVTEDIYFHLTQAELIELEMSESGGISEALKALSVATDGKKIMDIFRRMILTAYGKRTNEGRGFTKSEDLRNDFAASEAFSIFFTELLINTDAQIEFVRGIAPKDKVDEVVAAMLKAQEEQAGKTGEKKESTPPPVRNLPTPDSVEHISQADYLKVPREEVPELSARIARGEVVIDS